MRCVRGRRSPLPAAADAAPRRGRGAAPFRAGLLSNLANPKMAVFFTSLLPQFAPSGEGAFFAMTALGLVFCLLTLLWLLLYATVVAKAGDLLRRGPLRRALDAVMGTALVGLGARVAAQGRPA